MKLFSFGSNSKRNRKERKENGERERETERKAEREGAEKQRNVCTSTFTQRCKEKYRDKDAELEKLGDLQRQSHKESGRQ